MERELGCGFTERGLMVIFKKGFGLTTIGVRCLYLRGYLLYIFSGSCGRMKRAVEIKFVDYLIVAGRGLCGSCST